MATVVFTPNLKRHVESPTESVAGDTVRAVLDAVFAKNPKLRGYVLDDQGALRRHMMIFVDNQQITDRERLGDPVRATSEIYVMQALSGGSRGESPSREVEVKVEGEARASRKPKRGL